MVKTNKSQPKKLKKRKYSNLLHFRADARDTFVDQSGQEIPLKTGAIFDHRKITLSEQGSVKLENISFDNIENHRPLTVTKTSDKGSPIQALTPNRTPMYRADTSSFLTIFTNNEELARRERTPLRELPTNSDFFQSSPYQKVRTNEQDYTTHKAIITAAQLNQIKKEVKSRNQNRVMAKEGDEVSATAYANAAGINNANLPWEWLHKIAFRFLGQKGQVPDNLGCGTAHANTDMLILESALSELIHEFPEGFALTVISSYLKASQILIKIDYIVTIGNDEFTSTFNAQRTTKPLRVGQDYHHAFFKQLAQYRTTATTTLEDEFLELTTASPSL